MSLFSVDVINPDMTGRPAHARIGERIRAAIASGALAQRARLPSSRTLARDLGVARNTVDEALSQLVAEGLIVRRRGAGSFVSNRLPKRPPPLPAARRAAKHGVFEPRISKRAKALQGYPGHFKPNLGVPFTPSLPPSEFFPRKIWKRLLSREAARSGTAYWEYGASNGLPELREAIAGHATAMRGTRASADQVVVTTSTQQAVELAAKVLADPGDCCWVETPGYHAADGHTALLSQGVLASFITEGHLAQHLRATRAIYNERRLAFLEEAQILDGLLKFEPAIAGMHVAGLFRDASIDDRAVAAESARRGVPVDPLSKYGAIDCRGLVFGYAGASREEARERLNVVRRSITDVSNR